MISSKAIFNLVSNAPKSLGKEISRHEWVKIGWSLNPYDAGG